MKLCVVFKLLLANNANLSWLSFLFFLIIDLFFLILGAIAQIFNPTTELETPIGISTSKERQKLKLIQ